MASPAKLLPWLLGGAIGLGGILQGLQWRSSGGGGGSGDAEARDRIRILTEENDLLRRENESLRSLAQGGGEMAVPQDIIDLVEKDLGLRFLSNPVIHRIAREELRDRVAAAYENRFGPAGIDYRQEAYSYLGWLRPNDTLLPQLAALRSVGTASWFDETSGEGWVTDKFDIGQIPDQGALLAILSRILLHQTFPPSPSYPGDDSARAREALHQGAAAGCEARFLARKARDDGFISTRENHEMELLLASLGPFMQGLTTFPMMEGKGLADSLYVKGESEFHNAFRSPPQTTRSVLFPAFPPEPPPPLALPAVEEPFMRETAGMLGLRLWLEPLGDVGVASEIAAKWKNDRYVLFPDGDASSAVLWEIELEDPAAGDLLEATGLDLTAALSGFEVPSEPGALLATKEGRFIAFSRMSPTRLRFVNAATRETADKLRAAKL